MTCPQGLLTVSRLWLNVIKVMLVEHLFGRTMLFSSPGIACRHNLCYAAVPGRYKWARF